MMKKTIVFLFGLLSLSIPAQAAYESHAPLTDQELVHYRFSLQSTPVFKNPARPSPYDFLEEDGSLKIWSLDAGLGGVAAQPLAAPDDDDILYADWVFSGKDREGKTWSFYGGSMYSVAGPSSVFTADLDMNGIRDIVIWSPNAGNGMAPRSFVWIITFEQNGRPVPFFDAGFYQADSNGVQDLLDINKDGRAELFSMHFDAGYWISHLYQVKDARWRQTVGPFGRLTYPALTRFTDRPNRTPVTRIIKGRHPDVEKNRANAAALNNARYVLADSSGKRFRDIRTNAILETVGVPDIVVDDQRDGRTIKMEGAAQPLLEQMFQQQRLIVLYGKDNSFAGLANPHTLWALPERLSDGDAEPL